MTVNYAAKDLFAKLLASENITIRRGAFDTAYFDTNKRELGLPRWNINLDMPIGHEVGHALFTPNEGWMETVKANRIPKSYYNIVEDIRIERMIQIKFPGLRQCFIKGYRELQARNLFEIGAKTKHVTAKTHNFIDRLNLKAKLRTLIMVDFSEEELPYVKMAHAAETWDEVVTAAEAIYAYSKEKHEKNDNKNADEDDGEETPPPNSKGIDEPGDSEFNPSHDADEDENTYGKANVGDDDETDDEETGSSTNSVEDEGGDDDDDDDVDRKEKDQESGTGAGRCEEDMPDKTLTESVTDAALDQGMKDLVERDDNGNIQIVMELPEQRLMDTVIASYVQVKTQRSNIGRRSYLPSTKEAMGEAIEFENEHRAVVNGMVKEFELRKKAHIYSRATVSKTGSLDLNKLHEYKTNDDIFLRSTKLAEGKNHGMIMLIDYSASMDQVMRKVMVQVLQLAMFCKKTNIPFQVFGFSDGNSSDRELEKLAKSSRHSFYRTADERAAQDHPASLIANGLLGVKVFELLSSSLSKTDYKEAFATLVGSFYKFGGRRSPSTFEDTRGTPLNAALLVLPKIIRDFRNRHQIEKLAFVALTDGESAGIGGMSVDVGGGHVIHTNTETLIDNLRRYGVDTITNFFLVSSWTKRALEEAIGVEYHRGGPDEKLIRSGWRKNGLFTFKDMKGYDLRILINSRSSIMNGETEEFEPAEDATKNVIASAFRKFSINKTKYRVIASEFSKTIA